MKKKFFGITFSALFMVGILFSSLFFIPKEVNAAPPRTGEWIAVYNGNPTPQYWLCDYHWLHHECIEGDTRTSDPNTPED